MTREEVVQEMLDMIENKGLNYYFVDYGVRKEIEAHLTEDEKDLIKQYQTIDAEMNKMVDRIAIEVEQWRERFTALSVEESYS